MKNLYFTKNVLSKYIINQGCSKRIPLTQSYIGIRFIVFILKNEDKSTNMM